jgi:hypothetical protein
LVLISAITRPVGFDEKPVEVELENEEGGNSEDEDDLFVNTNRRFCGDDSD